MLLSEFIATRKMLDFMKKLADEHPFVDEERFTFVRPYVVKGYVRAKQRRRRRRYSNGKW